MRRGFLVPGVSAAAHGGVVTEAPLLSALPHGCVYDPNASGVNNNLLLLLHGHGDQASNFVTFGRKLQLPQTAVIALNGPLPYPSEDAPEGRTWFGDSPEEEGALLETCVRELTAVIERIVRSGFKHRQLHLCGFSDGGQVALELALRHHGHKALGSCVALSAALMSTDDRQRTAGPHTPVLLTRGALDDIVTEGAMTATVAALLQAAPTCGAHVVVAPGKEHAMPRSAAEMRPVMEFWSHTLRARPAATDDETLVELT